MSRERRKHERIPLGHTDVQVKFSIEIDGVSHEFNKVADVSISGMGLVLPIRVEVGAKIVLRFNSSDLNVELEGEVVWVETVGERHFIGVQFDSSNVDNNVLFFMSVREYLDHFDRN